MNAPAYCLNEVSSMRMKGLSIVGFIPHIQNLGGVEDFLPLFTNSKTCGMRATAEN